jgi:hypothetical protein
MVMRMATRTERAWKNVEHHDHMIRYRARLASLAKRTALKVSTSRKTFAFVACI